MLFLIQRLVAVKRLIPFIGSSLTIGLILASCGNSTVEVSIVNATQEDLLEVEVRNDKNETTTGLFDVKPGAEINKQLSFSTVSPSDGHYVLRMKEQMPRDFGYYSNGIPLENSIEIEVRTDTVLIKMK